MSINARLMFRTLWHPHNRVKDVGVRQCAHGKGAGSGGRVHHLHVITTHVHICAHRPNTSNNFKSQVQIKYLCTHRFDLAKILQGETISFMYTRRNTPMTIPNEFFPSCDKNTLTKIKYDPGAFNGTEWIHFACYQPHAPLTQKSSVCPVCHASGSFLWVSMCTFAHTPTSNLFIPKTQ